MVSPLKHDTLTFGCWCKPRVFLPCDECDLDIDRTIHLTDVSSEGRPCWKCGGSDFRGLVEVELPADNDHGAAYVVVHNNPSSRNNR